jgi:hypothetical protein
VIISRWQLSKHVVKSESILISNTVFCWHQVALSIATSLCILFLDVTMPNTFQVGGQVKKLYYPLSFVRQVLQRARFAQAITYLRPLVNRD